MRGQSITLDPKERLAGPVMLSDDKKPHCPVALDNSCVNLRIAENMALRDNRERVGCDCESRMAIQSDTTQGCLYTSNTLNELCQINRRPSTVDGLPPFSQNIPQRCTLFESPRARRCRQAYADDTGGRIPTARSTGPGVTLPADARRSAGGTIGALCPGIKALECAKDKEGAK